MNENTIIPSEVIEKRIFLIRGQKVMLDRHLAELYGVPTKRLNEAVKRNVKRFPLDFMFQLSVDENDSLMSQFATSKGRGGHRKLSFVFTEQGIAMLSSVLKSDRAVLVNIEIMRAFVKLRQLLSTHKDLAAKLEELERKYDAQFKVVFDAIRQIIYTPEKPKREIGFRVKETTAKYNGKRTRRNKAIKI
ncbi:MAG: ORF6N domain-containing protein [Ignavibacteriales bacterium]|nr:ORF6N domain-containing protein [Ignavibacteriales bacterium]